MARKVQLWCIILLTAITMMPQYALQGWLAFGGSPTSTDLFWLALRDIDPWAWSLRALVEAWALVYLFSSDPESAQDKKWLARFEVALIALITITLGPALAATGQSKSMKEWLAFTPFYWLWNFAIASYAPLMLGAVGFAFRLEKSQAKVIELAEQNESKLLKQKQPFAVQIAPANAEQKPGKPKQISRAKKPPEQVKKFPCLQDCGESFATKKGQSGHQPHCKLRPAVSTNGQNQ